MKDKPKKSRASKDEPAKTFNPEAKLRRKTVWINADFTGVESEIVEVRPGDLLEWRSRGAHSDFYVRFKGGRSARSPDASGQRALIAHAGSARLVVRELDKNETRPRTDYEIVGEAGTIDPRVIIDPRAQ